MLQKDIQVRQSRFLLIIIGVFAFFIALIGYLVFRQQKLKNKQQEQEFELKSAITQIETQNKLQEQRLAISRDLHDNIGAQLTFIISSVDNLKFGFNTENSKLDNKLKTISDFAQSTIVELRDTIWAMNNNAITFTDLKNRVLNFIEKAKIAKEEISFSFDIDKDFQNLKMTSIVGMNIYRAIQEAVNNSIKYAHAGNISIHTKHVDNTIEIYISDDGQGFDIVTTEKGNGLQNMKKRIEGIRGKFSYSSEIGKGTTIKIVLPEPKTNPTSNL
ncbi:sensor histidine kinase [Flavobacterium sp. 3HN19-14]|uniref:sensor histidine kinase n=1 Tax=Flavobacterium sp. 3HN19-14 TaxID=3448133 RepID=UPI003EE15379